MMEGYKTYKTRDFIRKTQQGDFDLEKSLALVRELAVAANYHADHNLLIDMRETTPLGTFSDTLAVAMEFAKYGEYFRNKMAVLIPDTLERRERAEFFKVGLGDVQFQMDYFTAFEDALEWLSEVKRYTD